MTGLEAWAIISANISELYTRRGTDGVTPYTHKEVEAEVMCFAALKKYDEENK